jgi:hypothetical protein
MAKFVRAIGAAIIAACCTPPPAVASNSDPYLSPNLRVEVRGVVPVTCQLATAATGSTVDFTNAVDGRNNIARADSVRIPFVVACNTPITIRMESTQGALTNSSTTSDRAFTSAIPYTANLDLPQRANALACDGAAMRLGTNGCLGEVPDQVTQGNGAIGVTLNPDSRLLLQGTYADRITITLTPNLGSTGTGS